MKKQLFNLKTIALALSSLLLVVGCSEDDKIDGEGTPTETKNASDRWITVAGAKMGSNPGDGNGGTLVYAVSSENAKNPDKVIAPFDYGYVVPSNRTARLQASADGNTLFNITYAGDSGGSFFKYNVHGGQEFNQIGLPVTVAQYVGTAPRWIKLFDGDNTGAAVYVSTEDVIDDKGTEDVTDDVYLKTTSKIAVVTISLANQEIIEFKDHTISLDDVNAAKGYYISRIDMPVLNKTGDKLYIGAQVRKKDPTTLEGDSGYDILGTKTIVLDYPSLDNPTIITSSVGFGNSNGYRSINAFEYNGDVYQANQGDPNGSHILKIGANNQYDDSYVFNLDSALGVSEAYVLAWRPTGNGKAILAYRHAGSAEGVSGRNQGYFALVDLNAKTATKINDIPYSENLDLFQYQHYAVNGNEIFVTVAPVGENGNIYVVNTNNGNVTKGAQLKNAEGSHFIGTW